MPNVATKKQMARLALDDYQIAIAANTAAEAINDILDNWGDMSANRCAESADRLRALADMVDGRETAGGNQNTYSYY